MLVPAYTLRPLMAGAEGEAEASRRMGAPRARTRRGSAAPNILQ